MKRPALFIDRDGTINEQMGYINHPDRFRILPGTAEAVRLLNQNGILAIVVSNQSGVARGYFPLRLVEQVHEDLKTWLKREGAVLDAIYFCPHHSRGTVPEFACECDCRKPRTGMIERAREAFAIDMTRSYAVGDRYLDIEMAAQCGIPGILVETGYGAGEREHILPGKPVRPAHIAPDLLGAVRWVLDHHGIPAGLSPKGSMGDPEA